MFKRRWRIVRFEECDLEPTDAEFYHEFSKYNTMSMWITLIFILTCFCSFSLRVDDALHETVVLQEISCLHASLSDIPWERDEIISIFYPELRLTCMMYDHNITELKEMTFEDAQKMIDEMKEKPGVVFCSEQVRSNGFSGDTDFVGTCKGYLYKMRLVSFLLLGISIGSLPLGVVSDLWGRKIALYVAVSFYFVGGLFQALIVNFDTMQFFAVLKGVGRGGIDNLLLLLLLEYCGPGNRAMLVVYMTMFGPIGIQVGITIKKKLYGHWKELNYILAVPSLILLFYIWYIPESPRWYLSFCKKKKAWQFLNSLGTPIDRYHFLSDVKINTFTVLRENMTYLCNSIKLLKILFMGAFLLSFLLFAELHKKQFIALSHLKPFAHHCIVCTARVFSYMYVLQPLLMLRRRLALLCFLLLIAVQLFINIFTTAVGFYIVNTLVLLCLHAVKNILALYLGEVFPTCLRGSALGLLGSVAYSVFTFHFIYKLSGRFIINWIGNLLYFVVSCIAIVMVWFLPEVKLAELPDYKRYRRDFT